MFGDQQSELRNAARLVVAWVWPKDKNLGEDIVRLIAALAPASGAWIRHETHPLDVNQDLLTEKEMRYVIGCQQPPVALGAMISKRLLAAPIETFERVAIEQNIVAFMNTLAPLIRLSTQPLYLTYTRVAVRMLILFLLGGYCRPRPPPMRALSPHAQSHALTRATRFARSLRPAVCTLCLHGLDDCSCGCRDDHHVRDDREHGDPDREPAAGAASVDPDDYHATTRRGDARKQAGIGGGGHVMGCPVSNPNLDLSTKLKPCQSLPRPHHRLISGQRGGGLVREGRDAA